MGGCVHAGYYGILDNLDLFRTLPKGSVSITTFLVPENRLTRAIGIKKRIHPSPIGCSPGGGVKSRGGLESAQQQHHRSPRAPHTRELAKIT